MQKRKHGPRTKKTSQGVHGGGGKVALTPIQKVLLGGGVASRGYIEAQRRKSH